MSDLIVDSLIFDMDGTLWDAVETYVLGWNQFFAENNINKKLDAQFLESYMGVEEKIFLKLIFPELSDEELTRLYRNEIVPYLYKAVDQYGGILFPGVKEGLEKLSEKYPLFIVSNCPEKLIVHFMDRVNISHLVTDSMAYGQNYQSKNENIKLLVDKYGLRRPVYIGDTDSDRVQSEKAGVPFVFVDYGFGSCNKFFKRFSDFDSLLGHFINYDYSK